MKDQVVKILKTLISTRYKNEKEFEKYLRKTFYSGNPIELVLNNTTDHEETKHDYEYMITMDNGDFLCDVTFYVLFDRQNYLVITEVIWEFED